MTTTDLDLFECNVHGYVSMTCDDDCNLTLRTFAWTDTGMQSGHMLKRYMCGCVDRHVNTSDGMTHMEARTVCPTHTFLRDARIHGLRTRTRNAAHGTYSMLRRREQYVTDHYTVGPRLSEAGIESYAHSRGYDSYLDMREALR